MQAILELDPARLEQANQVYAALRFEPSRASVDRTFGALDEEQELLGLGRLQDHGQAVLEVGGFWVREDQRRRGWARRLVEHVLEAAPRATPLWCLPLDHLVDFYVDCGLARVPSDETLPAPIEGKVAACLQTFGGDCGGADYTQRVVLRRG